MTKFWMVTMSAILFGLTTTGCPDDDNCPPNICDTCGNGFCGAEEYAGGECPEDCGSGFCGDGICEGLGAGRETCATCVVDCGTCPDGGADADADADSDTAEDDGDANEVTDCPNVTGEWALTYDRSSTTIETHWVLHLEQDGCSLTGYEEGGGDISGTLHEDGSLTLQRDYGSIRTLTGNLVNPSRLQGNWDDPELGASSTWYANLQ